MAKPPFQPHYVIKLAEVARSGGRGVCIDWWRGGVTGRRDVPGEQEGLQRESLC